MTHPTGTVNFSSTSLVTGVTSILATARLNAAGTAQFSTAALPAGTNEISALYAGDSNYYPEPSLYVAEQVKPQSATTTKLTFNANPTTVGHSYTVSATVAAAAGTTPTGSVVFYSEGSQVGTATLSGSGIATITAPVPTAAGPVTWQAVYSGDTNDTPSTSTVVNETVAPAPATVTSLSFNPHPVTTGHSYTVTATITAAQGPTPAGTILFYSEGSQVATATLNGSGAATITAPAPTSAGQVTWQAVYSGSSNDAASRSLVVNQTVTAA